MPAMRSVPPFAWLHDFLKEELAPYPGRGAIVARIVIAATLIMLVGMIFRIPYTWQGAIYALFVSRESPRATLRASATIFTVTAIGAVYILVSISFVIGLPMLQFLWVIVTLFVTFYIVSSLTTYIAAVAFANLVAAAIPLWDRHISAETNVANTLWLCLATFVAVSITALVELVFVRLRPGNEIVVPFDDRFAAVEELFGCYADGHGVTPAVAQKINRLEVLGTSMLRRSLRRSNYSTQLTIEVGGIAGLVGRLVDLAAALIQVNFEMSAIDQRRFRELASTLAHIRNDLLNRKVPAPVQFHTDEVATRVPLLGQLEHTVSQIPEVFAGSRYARDYLPSIDDVPKARLFVADAFTNPDHIQFALKGCLAASLCYITYNAIDWQGISTAVTTCMLTALTTVGSSRQKQLLRIVGAMLGGFLGMGSQVSILPHFDSIAGFTLLFVAVTVLGGWLATSSPRLSYVGVQLALAFYLVNVETFNIQTSLAVARDRVAGILLGLFVMWLVFDQLWRVSAALEMKRKFISNLRSLATFVREPLSSEPKIALAQNMALRETINSNLDKVRALADGVLLEFGRSRAQDLALRDHIRRWQSELRMLFITRIVLWRYRLPLPGFELPEPVAVPQREFDDELAKTLDTMADRFEGKPGFKTSELQRSLSRLEEIAASARKGDLSREHPARIDSFLTLSRRAEALAHSLDQEIECFVQSSSS
jgi:multidrug resistance protein MdtO